MVRRVGGNGNSQVLGAGLNGGAHHSDRTCRAMEEDYFPWTLILPGVPKSSLAQLLNQRSPT